VIAGGLDGMGERLIRTFLTVWDSPAGTAAAALLRSATSHEKSARMLREFATKQILSRVAGQLDLDPAEAGLRASLVASQVIGLAMARYIVKIEPLAHAPRETLIAAIGPTLQRYLTGPLGGVGPADGARPADSARPVDESTDHDQRGAG